MYAQVVRPQGKILELEQKFVLLRIVNMYGVDIGIFDFDYDTTFAVITLNEEGQIYSRYGGRDSKSAESFVGEASFTKALERSHALHTKWQAGELELPATKSSKSPESYPFVAGLWGRCLHCHDVASAQAIEKFSSPDFHKINDVWIYPEPASLGLDIDPDDGTSLRSVTGAAEQSGLKAGDQITAINSQPVSTFTDIQHVLHHLPKDTNSAQLTLQDDRSINLPLNDGWRRSDISWRRMGMRLTPAAGFGGSPLAAEQKEKLNLPSDSFATSVSFFDIPKPEGSPLQQGDIILAINGTSSSPLTNHAGLHLSLNHQVGETVELSILRNSAPQTVEITLIEPPSSTQRIMNGKGGGMKGKGGMRGKGRMKGKGGMRGRGPTQPATEPNQ